MTYKNIKFEDSPVMRSLEKLAVKKGLVKTEVINKTAVSKKNSLKPTENLEENILKLCSALRDSGFNKQAVEVETKFFNLKKAEHIYDTHGETGEDVINQAHPEGSHQMKNVDGDAIIETILDRKKIMENIVSKMPTGKQGSRALADFVKNASKNVIKHNAINAISAILSSSKIVVASNMQEVQQLLQSAAADTQSAVELAANAGNLYNVTINWARGRAEAVASTLNNISNNSIEEAITSINALIRNFQPNFASSILPDFMNKGLTNEQVHQAVESKLNAALAKVTDAQNKFRELVLHPESATVTPERSATVQMPTQEVSGNKEVGELYNLANGMLNKLNGWKPTLNTYPDKQDRAESIGWINTMISAIQNITAAMDQTPDEVAASVIPNWRKSLTDYSKQVSQFYETWIA